MPRVLTRSSLLTGQKDIAETVTLSGEFNILAASLNAPDLAEVLKEDGPYTALAPSDEAFDNLPTGTLDYLFKSENKDVLICLVRYHVVPGKVPAEDVARCCELRTIGGEVISIEAKRGHIMVDRATIINENIECSNGVIHAIDLVAVPKRWV